MVELRLAKGTAVILINGAYGNEKEFEFKGFQRFKGEVNLLLDPIVDHMKLIRVVSALSFCRRAVWIDEAFLELNIVQLPTKAEDWSNLVLKVHEYVFTTPNHNYSAWSRGRVWGVVHQVLTLWQDKKIIPGSVKFPPTRNVTSAEIEKYREQLIGQKPLKPATSHKLDKLVGSFEISTTDDDFFERLGNKLASSRNVLHSVLIDYWRTIKANYEFGKQLIAKTDMDKLLDECYNYKSKGKPYHPCDYRNGLDGLQNLLALSKYQNNGYLLSRKARNSWSRNGNLPTPIQTYIPISSGVTTEAGGLGNVLGKYIFSKPQLPPNFVTKERLMNRRCAETRQTFNWMLGNLSPIDVGAICGLLMMLNPQFTPSAILSAKITDKNSNNYLVNLDGIHTFTVEKHRAKQLKTSELDEVSLDIISTVLEMSESRRVQLEKENSEAVNLLFLPINIRTNKLILGNERLSGQLLSGSCKRAVWLGDYYPELEENGLGRGTISASKIRATEGVLEWFKTGSITAMSRKLGNTYKVAIKHYIPQALLNAWHTRLIRRYQNLWIAVAAAGEPFVLEVTDFKTIDELHFFLKDMLNLHQRGKSPLADVLHERFTDLSGLSLDQLDQSGALHIEISESNLSVLYTYYLSAIGIGDPKVLSQLDSTTRLAPQVFVDIARLLINKLPTHNDPSMSSAHFSAFKIAEKWVGKLNWTGLMIAGTKNV